MPLQHLTEHLQRRWQDHLCWFRRSPPPTWCVKFGTLRENDFQIIKIIVHLGPSLKTLIMRLIFFWLLCPHVLRWLLIEFDSWSNASHPCALFQLHAIPFGSVDFSVHFNGVRRINDGALLEEMTLPQLWYLNLPPRSSPRIDHSSYYR